MSLNNLIAGSYGEADCIFAGHNFDRQRAREALIVANENGIGYSEFIGLHRQYLTDRGCSQEHIDNQIRRIKNIDLYFDAD